MSKFTIIWTTQAKEDLRNIYDYWKKKSPQGAKNVITSILKTPKLFIIQNNIKLMISIQNIEEWLFEIITKF